MPPALPRSPLVLRLRLTRYWLLLPMLATLSAIGGAVIYLATPYQRIADWYRALNPCFYRSHDWQQSFFTAGTYRAGRIWCTAGILVATVLTLWMVRLFRGRGSWLLNLAFTRADCRAIFTLWAFAIGIWVYGMLRIAPCYDEVFSAVNCAGIHPFQTASYYMLPNNHVLFNLLNALIGRLFSDNLVSARIISGAAFFLFVPVLYKWFRRMKLRPLTAAAFTGLMLLQFPVWGFSFQGRGYTLYLLCAWTAFVSLQHYFETGNRRALLPHTLATVIGFWIMPAYLFWEAGLLLYAIFGVLKARRLHAELVGSLALTAGFVFLAYLPILAFSGIRSITANPYVIAEKVSWAHYAPRFWAPFRSGIQYTFSGSVDAQNVSYLLAFVLPVALLPLLARTRVATTLLFLLFIWGSFALLLFYMQRFPFMRNLVAHASITLAALLLACYAFLEKILRGRAPALLKALPLLACLGAGIHFAQFNREHIHDGLYFHDSDRIHHELRAAMGKLPAGSRIWLSDEGFYWEYLAARRGLQASMCQGSDATHYIHLLTEPLPAALRTRVRSADTVWQYEILELAGR